MPQHTRMHVHLQEGFEAERVIVSVNGTVLLDDPEVRTRPQIGLARATEADTTADAVTVYIELPDRPTNGTVGVQPKATPFVGVSVSSSGDVQFRTQAEPFGYL